jgi:hypothetical protein
MRFRVSSRNFFSWDAPFIRKSVLGEYFDRQGTRVSGVETERLSAYLNPVLDNLRDVSHKPFLVSLCS